ncbi:MAG: hypothetical protein JJU18_08210 [Oceanicaulis sp.]|nr:hypothetical protein [Oceanicaulis sp.]
MTDNAVRPHGRVTPADAIAVAAVALFAGICAFCAIGALVWAIGLLTGLPVLALGAAEALVLIVCLAASWLLFRKGLQLAANGFEGA